MGTVRVRVILLSNVARRDVDALMGHVDAKVSNVQIVELSTVGLKRARSRMRCMRVVG